MGESPAVGPVLVDSTWSLLCPVCEATTVATLDEQPTTVGDAQCVAIWLTGRELQHAPSFGDRTCLCFLTDPYADEEVEDKKRRFFLYRTVAALLGAVGQRVNLPSCVRAKIEEQYGTSEVGFRSA